MFKQKSNGTYTKNCKKCNAALQLKARARKERKALEAEAKRAETPPNTPETSSDEEEDSQDEKEEEEEEHQYESDEADGEFVIAGIGKIHRVLDEMEVKYTSGMLDLVNPRTNRRVYWDTIITTTTGKKILFHYQHRGHFEAMPVFGGEYGLEMIQYRDGLRRSWSEDKGHRLFAIKHTSFENIEGIICEFMRRKTSWIG